MKIITNEGKEMNLKELERYLADEWNNLSIRPEENGFTFCNNKKEKVIKEITLKEE